MSRRRSLGYVCTRPSCCTALRQVPPRYRRVAGNLARDNACDMGAMADLINIGRYVIVEALITRPLVRNALLTINLPAKAG